MAETSVKFRANGFLSGKNRNTLLFVFPIGPRKMLEVQPGEEIEYTARKVKVV